MGEVGFAPRARSQVARIIDQRGEQAGAAAQWHLAELHQLASGRGTRVAVIDSGIDASHPDLAGQVAVNRNFVSGQALAAERHGTAVAGIIAAKADNRMGIAGGAWERRRFTPSSAARARCSRRSSWWSATSWKGPMSEFGASPELRLRRVWQGEGGALIRGALSVAAGAYRGALAARDTCYAAGMFSTRRLPVPVISIGNLTLGGSGKTPLAALVANALSELGTSPAIVSRGYGRRTHGVRVVADRDGVRLSAREAGDEPRLLAEDIRAFFRDLR